MGEGDLPDGGMHVSEVDLKLSSRLPAGPALLPDPPGTIHATRRQWGILVVDDEAYVRDVLHLGLRQEGFAVWQAATGRQAIELYRRHHPGIDVVLMDVRMPGLDGAQTLRALQELNPRVRCYFMTGDLGDYTEESLRNLGARAVLQKPFSLAEVSRVLREEASAAFVISAQSTSVE